MGAEFAQLLDAFMNLKLDAEDTGKAIPRMSIETSVASTKLDQVTQELKDARSLLDNEKQKRDEAETKIENMMAQLRLIFSGNLQKEVHVSFLLVFSSNYACPHGKTEETDVS